MKVLVTGGAGFIGSYVTAQLVHRGHEPLVLDRHSAGQHGHRVMLGDVRDATAVTEAVAHADGVIHLAGVLGTQETITNPVPAAETNILGGLNVLQACGQYDTPLVNIAVGNWFETNTYSVTKHAVERFTAMYARYRGLACCNVRAFNVYGPGQSVAQPYGTSRVRKIIPSFACRALHGEPIEVYGDGSQVMDMIYATDAAAVLTAALQHLHEGGKPGGLHEAGTGRATTVQQIADMVRAEVRQQTGRDTAIVNLPMRAGETPGGTVLADPRRLDVLGVDAAKFTPLEAGLKRTVAHYKALL